MRLSWLKSLVAVGVSVFVPVQALAQPLFTGTESIECTVANSEIVVVGNLVEFAGQEQADERGGRVATIAVEETLKGEHRDRLRVRLLRPASVLAQWKDPSGRLLLAARGDPPAETGVIDLADKELQVLTADFTTLRKPEEVLRVAKETVRRMPGVTRIETFRLVAPGEAVAGTRWEKYYRTGGYVTVTVPVDERLEKRAHEYVRSPIYGQREEAARALRYFKSDENVARLKTLLNDPGWDLRRAEDNKGVEVRIYGIREKAYETLKYWGVSAQKPTTREETWKPDSVRTVVLSNGKVTAADLKALARFKNLQNVFLWNTDVTDAQLKDLAPLTNLRDLYLGGTQVTDVGLKHLAGLMNLRYLDLGNTRVTDEGLKVLAGFKSLQKLDLGGAKVTAGGVAELHKIRPDVKTER
jgi:hypothetical protein